MPSGMPVWMMPERIPPSSGTAIPVPPGSAAGFQPGLSCCHITPD